MESYGKVWVPDGGGGWCVQQRTLDLGSASAGLLDDPWGWRRITMAVGATLTTGAGPPRGGGRYSPALVVFLGGGVHVGVSVGRPVYWAPLGWGEPSIPWWGRRGFVGVPSWHGWGGPRVVNNVVVRNTTVVNVQNITVYRNVTVNNAVVGVPADRFGRGAVVATRVNATEVRQLAPVRGAPEVRPVAASVTASWPRVDRRVSVQQRSWWPRAPRVLRPTLREQGLAESSRPSVVESAPRIVPAPTPTVTAPSAVTIAPRARRAGRQ